MLPYIITAVVSIIITALIVWFAAASYEKKSANSKIGNAEEKARGIIDEAVRLRRKRSASLCLRSRKSLLRLRMIWIRKSKSVETRFPVMSVVSFRRKKMSTRARSYREA